MRHLLRLLLAFAGALIVGTPAFALSGPCDHLSPTLLPNELRLVESALLKTAPVKYHALAKNIRVLNDTESDAATPYAVPREGGGDIFIPSGFRKLQCQVVTLRFLQEHIRIGSAFGLLQDSIRACLAIDRSKTIGQCTTETTDDIYEEFASYMVVEGNFRSTIDASVGAAFLSTMLHEQAHIVLGHTAANASMAPDAAKLRAQEKQADEYSTYHLLVSAQLIIGPMWQYAMLSVIDPILGDDTAHETSLCRARATDALLGKLVWTPLLYAYTNDLARYEFLRERRERDQGKPVTFLSTPEDSQKLAKITCPSATAIDVEAVQRDLKSMVTILDGALLTSKRDQSPRLTMAVLESVSRLPLETPQGRGLRGNFIAEALPNMLLENQADESRLMAQGAALIDRLVANGDTADMLSDEYAVLLMVKAQQTLQENINHGDVAIALSKEAEDYSPGDLSVLITRASVQRQLKHCKAARLIIIDALTRARDNWADTMPVYQAFSTPAPGKCID